MSDRPRDDAASLVGRLYDTYGGSLYRYALLLLANAEAAEDVVQQVLASILRHPIRMQDEAGYLRRAVRNECYSHLRRQRVRKDPDPTALLEPAAAGVSQDEKAALEQAIRSLPPEQREVIHLHVFEGLTFQEIANASETSINTISARYRYALANMRRFLT